MRSRSSTKARGCGARRYSDDGNRVPGDREGLASEGRRDPHDLPDQPGLRPRNAGGRGLESLAHALRVGDGIGALGVVVHPGALKDDTRANAKKRAIKLIKEALARSERARSSTRTPPAQSSSWAGTSTRRPS